MSVAANSGFVVSIQTLTVSLENINMMKVPLLISAVRRQLRSHHAAAEKVVPRELWDIMRGGQPRALVKVYIQKIFHIPFTVCFSYTISLLIRKREFSNFQKHT
jgi:hypothetical protein